MAPPAPLIDIHGGAYRMKLKHFLGAAALIFSSHSMAAVTFSYLGDDFTAGPGASGPIDPIHGLLITGTVEFDDAVGAHFTGVINSNNAATAPLLLTYNITSGPVTFFRGDGISHQITGINFEFADGQIVHWLMGIIADDNRSYLLTQNDRFIGDFASANLTSNVNGNFSFTPGVWTRVAPAPVPLPASLWLLGASGALLGACRRKRIA